MRIAAVFLVSLAWAIPASAQEDPALLELFLGRALETVVKQPDYTCLETVERVRQIASGRQRVEDTLRLEVALVDGREMFAWPGSGEFEDTEINELVTSGMFGNGNFGLYSRMLFNYGHPPFTFGGREVIDGRTVARYDFRVPRSESGYRLMVGEKRGIAGFYGSFYFDVGTLDLRRLQVNAFEIPPELQLTSAQDQIEYSRVKIGDDSFVLPAESTLILAVAGSAPVVNRNHVRFSGCRKFTGESSLILFDESALDAVPELPVPVREVTIPRDMELDLSLQTSIDLANGFAGEAVEARLERDVKVDGKVIAPKGAVAKGRIVRLERYPEWYALGLRFTDLEWKGGHAKLEIVFVEAPFVRGAGRDPFSGDIVVQRRIGRLNKPLTVWLAR